MSISDDAKRARLERDAARRAAVIEDTEFLLDMGVHPNDVARRLGYKSRDNMLVAMHRWGREDLVSRLCIADTKERVDA